MTATDDCAWLRRVYQRVLFVLSTFAVCLVIGPERASAISVATGPNGARINFVKQPNTFNLSGTGVNIGQVEPGRPGDPQVLIGPGNPELNHPNVNPGGAAVGVADLGAGPVANSPPTAGAGLSDHATQVAGVMNSNLAGALGVAHGSTLFSANGVLTVPSAQVDLVVASEWVRGRNTPVINFSFGAPLNEDWRPPNGVLDGGMGGVEDFDNDGVLDLTSPHFKGVGNAVLNGNSLLSLYVDYSAFVNNTLIVVAGNEDFLQTRAIPVPTDAYNGITVGATTQRAAGANVRFDQVANFNSSNVTSDGRIKTDIVAPGGSSVRATITNGVTGAVRTTEVFPPVLGANESVTGITTLFNTSDLNMPSLDANQNGFLGDVGFARSGGTSFAAPLVTGVAALLQQHAVNNGLATGHGLTKVVILNSASKHVLGTDPDGTTNPLQGQAWPVAYAANNPTPTFMKNAIHPQMGVGQLNGLAAVKQYVPNFRSDVGLQSSTVSSGGTDTYNLFVGGQKLKPGSLVTATLTWDRAVTNPTNNLTSPAAYNNPTLPDLDLFLVRRDTGQTIAASRSFIDNVEHIYFNVPTDDDYDLQVRGISGANVPYSLAWTSGTSHGLAFSVDGGAFNNNRGIPANAAEGQQAPFGNNPFPNDVNSLGTTGPANFATEGEIFVSSQDGTNMQRFSGALGTQSRVGPHNAPPAAMSLLSAGQRGTLGLVPNDNVVGLSWGTDGTLDGRDRPQPAVIVFSVDPFGSGSPDTDVRIEAQTSPAGGPAVNPLPDNPGGGDPGGEVAGDIFKTPELPKFGMYRSERLDPAPPGRNILHIDEEALGLQAPVNKGNLSAFEDDLDALEMDNPLENPRRIIDNQGDGLHDAPVFFNLDRYSPSALGGAAGTPSAADIFVSTVNFDFDIFADGENDIHLESDDAIDALILSDVGTIGFLDAGVDEALFSLDPFSFSGLPGDIYYTDFIRPFNPALAWDAGGSLYATAGQIGLLTVDNLNALDIFRLVPEPATVILALLALFGGYWLRSSGRMRGRMCP